jgi:filamentous hemagglutinin family protein
VKHTLSLTVISFTLLVSNTIACSSVTAQITPDTTLGTETSSSVSSRVGILPAIRINGGSVRGTYLFHSFSEFNVAANQRVYFTNPAQVRNILTRVTGDNPSSILGTLGVDGSANLFLLNPNGILFGSRAMLDIRGSFTASTGDRFTFPDGSEFSAVNPQVPPILNIDVPIGLQVGARVPGNIINEGVLEVGPSQALTLWAGSIINTGTLLTTDGQIQLNATQNIVFNGSSSEIQTSGGDVLLRAGGDISIANQANINSFPNTGFGDTDAGDITLRADGNISILNGGSVFSTIPSGVTGNAGAISIQAGRVVTAQSARISNSVRGTGNGAVIDISGRTISITDNSRIFAVTSTDRPAGVVKLRSADAIDVSNSVIGPGSNEDATGSGGRIEIQTGRFTANGGTIISAESLGSGRAGDILITVNQLNIENADLNTETFSDGSAGNLIINATGTITVGERGRISTSAVSGIGNAGNLTINAQGLNLSDGGLISSSTSSSGNGGNLRVNARQLTMRNGGQISTGTFSAGNAGDLTIFAGDRVRLLGVAEDGTQSGLFTQSTDSASGNAGTLRLTTGELELSDRAGISVSGIGGNPGNLLISADRISLNRGILEAITASGENANIELRVADTIFMQRNSLISAEARNDGSGGNLTIDTGFLIALSNQNNDIVANAFNGPGGQIIITAEGILGLAERRAISGNITNDIDASSQFGASGTVTINSPDDLNRGLVELPIELVDASRLIAQSCATGGVASQDLGEFYITGRGGLPPNPIELLNGETVMTSLADVNTHPQEANHFPTIESETPVVVEAQSWVVDAYGTVLLTAHTPHTPAIALTDCARLLRSQK